MKGYKETFPTACAAKVDWELQNPPLYFLSLLSIYIYMRYLFRSVLSTLHPTLYSSSFFSFVLLLLLLRSIDPLVRTQRERRL